jgi:hypothetical protein
VATLAVAVIAPIPPPATPPPTSPAPPPNQFAALNAIYDVTVSGIVNGCSPHEVHHTRDYQTVLTVANINADGKEGTASVTNATPGLYSASAVLASGRFTLTLRVTIDGYAYEVPLLQDDTERFGGTEVITGPGPCTARYSWIATRR